MKRFVRHEAGLAYMLGAVGGMIVGFTDASAGASYLIAFGLGMVGLAIFLGPDRVQLWREQHGSSSARHPK
jgi:hypothetical protein